MKGSRRRKPAPSAGRARGAMRVRARRGVMLAAGLLLSLALVPAVSQAFVEAGATPAFPTTVTVGATGLSATVEVRNNNTTRTTSVDEHGLQLRRCVSVSGGRSRDHADPVVRPVLWRVLGLHTGRRGPRRVPAVCDRPGPGGHGVRRHDLRHHADRSDLRDRCASRRSPQDPRAASGRGLAVPDRLHVRRAQVAQRRPEPDPGRQPDRSDPRHTQHSAAGSRPRARDLSSSGTTVLPAPTTIATTASPNITLGAGTLTDTAIVSGRVNPRGGRDGHVHAVRRRTTRPAPARRCSRRLRCPTRWRAGR